MIGLACVVWLAAAPAGDSLYSKEQLDALVASSELEYARFHGRCVTPSAPPDVEAEQAFSRMAELRHLVVLHYPYGKKDHKVHADDVSTAAQLYESAYRCNPGWSHRGYLEKAFELVQMRTREIREDERRPETAEDYVMLLGVASRLREQLGTIQPPSTGPSAARPCPKPPPIVQEPETKGYRGRYMGLFSLRVELGPMLGAVLNLPEDPDNPSAAVDMQFFLSLAPGVRLLAGAKQRHVFGLGFRYTALAYDQNPINVVDRLAARFEYGVRAHLRWLSIHAGFEPGIQAQWTAPTFGHVNIDLWAAMCTWGEALCVRGGWGSSVRPRNGSTDMAGGFLAFGLDIFRVADNVLRAMDGEKTP